MPRASVTKPFYTFNGGINTEANSANYPENSALDTLNVDINSNGTVSRRKTLESEGGKVGAGTTITFDKFRNTFYWKNVGNVVGLTFIVQQFQDDLHFFQLIGDNAGSNYTGSVNLSLATGPYSFSTIDGDLIVADPIFGPKIVTFTSPSTFTSESINVRIRDFEGVDDGHEVDFNPLGVKEDDRPHWYNLRNQGWLDEHIDTYTTKTELDNPGAGWMPSNAEVWHIATSDTDGSFGAPEVVKVTNFDWGSTPAPRGREIVGVFNPSLDRQQDNPDIFPTPNAGIPADETPSIVASYASRIFYAQSATNISAGRVLFSQIPDSAYDQEKRQKYGACFSKNDPTADTFNELLETDGGVIEIQDLGKVKAMAEVQGSLIVFSDQGVWTISGGDSGFTAVNLQVKKVSTIGVEKGTSVVFTGDGAFYHSGNAIYAVSYDQTSLALTVSNVTENSIKTLLRTTFSKADHVYGTFDKVSNKVLWLFQKDDPAGHSGTTPLDPDNLLILDLASGAFTRYELGRVLSTSGLFTAGIVAVEEGEIPDPLQESDSPFANAVSTDMLNIKIVYAEELPGTILTGLSNFNGLPGDSDTVGGGSLPENAYRQSRLLTGPQTLGDASRGKDVLYMTTVFNRTENEFEEVTTDNIILTNQSSCLGKIYWDWSDGKDNRFSPQQQLYRLNRVFVAPDVGTNFDYGKGVLTTKTKMRGAGKAFSFEFLGEQDKDFQLVGWSIETSAGGAV